MDYRVPALAAYWVAPPLPPVHFSLSVKVFPKCYDPITRRNPVAAVPQYRFQKTLPYNQFRYNGSFFWKGFYSYVLHEKNSVVQTDKDLRNASILHLTGTYLVIDV